MGFLILNTGDRQKIKQEEPEVQAVAALFSPSTGIISAHDLMTAYLGDIESCGGSFVGQTRVTSVEQGGKGFIITSQIGGDSYKFTCEKLINAAGLGAQGIHAHLNSITALMFLPYICAKGVTSRCLEKVHLIN